MISEEIRIKGLKHVFYEICQLELCADKLKHFTLTPPPPTDAGNCERASYLEAFLIHLRALRDFFERSPKNPDDRDPTDLGKKADIFSQDYGFTSRQIGFDMSIKDRLDKEVAHITYHRLLSPVGWASQPTIEKMRPVVREFILHLKGALPNMYQKGSPYFTSMWVDDECEHYMEIIERRVLVVQSSLFQGTTGPARVSIPIRTEP